MRCRLAAPEAMEVGSNPRGGRNIRIGLAKRGQRMGIAAPHHGFSPIARQQGRGRIVDSGYLSIQCLHGWEQLLKEEKVEIGAAAGQAGKHVVDAEEKFALVEIS